MYIDYYYTENSKIQTSLGIRLIYRVLADHTYVVTHPATIPGHLVFVYTDKGLGHLKCAEGDFYLEPGTVLVFSSDVAHYYETCGTEWHFWWFEFTGLSPCPKGELFSLPVERWIETLCSMALSALRSESPNASSYLSCLLAYTADSQQHIISYGKEIFFKAQSIIKEKLYHTNVTALAEELSVTPRTLYNLFMRYEGCSPKTYLRNYTLDIAKYLLTNTTKSIGSIAYELGFTNQFHFSSVFRESVGISPSKYKSTDKQQ